VHFAVGESIFVRPEDGRLTLSAAGLFLLRTLSVDHTLDNPVSESNLLFPCCGHTAWVHEGRFRVLCMGCPNGKNPEVIHQGDSIVVKSEQAEVLPFMSWKNAVFGFVDEVRTFYDQSLPKTEDLDEHDRAGWAAFWEEWRTRRAASYF
jgi:hypothetical protein